MFILPLECLVYKLFMKQKCHFLVSLPSLNARLQRRVIDVGYYVQMVCIPMDIVTDLYCISIKSYQYRNKRVMHVVMDLKYNKLS